MVWTYDEECPWQLVAHLVQVVDEDGQDDGGDDRGEEGYRADYVEWDWRVVRWFDGFGAHGGC